MSLNHNWIGINEKRDKIMRNSVLHYIANLHSKNTISIGL